MSNSNQSEPVREENVENLDDVNRESDAQSTGKNNENQSKTSAQISDIPTKTKFCKKNCQNTDMEAKTEALDVRSDAMSDVINHAENEIPQESASTKTDDSSDLLLPRSNVVDSDEYSTTPLLSYSKSSLEVTEKKDVLSADKIKMLETAGLPVLAPQTVLSSVPNISTSIPLQVSLPENMVTDGLPSASLPGPSTASPPSPLQSVYHIKWMKWKDHKTAIITQNENGPCPLIAIMNVLVLKGKVNLPPIIEMITADQLMEYLGDCILDNAPKNISEDAQLNYEQNMHDAMAVLPKLQTGLDVNVKFTGVNHFEYTPECIIFDLLNIPLYHGWLVDPQTPLVAESVGNSSYNQLVERIIRDKASSDADVVVRALNAESFLERTASQLTYHGLCELNAAVQDDELCVMFRNNHFSTIYKHKNELFQLVTDQGFLTESCVVWETLSSIDGDGQFVDCNFATVPPRSATCSAAASAVPAVQQIDQDYLVALSLQEEQQHQVEQEIAWQEYKEKQLGIVDTVTDEELARRLQLEEQELQPPTGQSQPLRGQPAEAAAISERHSEGKKKSDCTIL